MSRAPNWTPEEFEIVLTTPNETPEQLSRKVTKRTAGAVEVVQQGIHAFHSGLDTSMLSKMMLNRLEGNTKGLSCPICKTTLD